MGRTNPLGPQEEAALVRAAQGGDAHALAELIQSHRGFLVQRARRGAAGRAEVDDLVQEGICGLLQALKRYDPERAEGARLLTYARHDIDKAIRRAILRSGLGYGGTRVSEASHRAAWRLAAVEESLRAELGRAPRPAEFARAAGLSLDEVTFLRELRFRREADPTELERAQAPEPGSSGGDPLERLVWADLGARARRAFRKLPEAQRRVLERAFHLGGEGVARPRPTVRRADVTEALAALRRLIETRR